MGSADFIEFYGKKQRNELDRYLYSEESQQLNPWYSLFTDTATYYLTWTEEGNGQRFNNASQDLSTTPPAQEYFWHTERVVLSTRSNGRSGFVQQEYNSQGSARSIFDEGEGFSGGLVKKNTIAVATPNVLSSFGDAELIARYLPKRGTHDIVVRLNGQQVMAHQGFTQDLYRDTISISSAGLTNNTSVEIEGVIDNTSTVAVSEVAIRYPRAFDFGAADFFRFQVPQATGSQYLEITNFNHGGQAPILYNLTTGERLVCDLDNGVVQILLLPNIASRDLLLVSQSGISEVSGMEASNFGENLQTDTEYLIISHKSLMEIGQGVNPVEEYADYRSSISGGGYVTSIADIENLYDRFAYGIEGHPLAIRNYVHYLLSQSTPLKYVFLLGKGREYKDIRLPADKVNDSELPLLVPTWGFPASDVLLVSDDESLAPLVPVGRIAASNPEEILIYLDKVKKFESNLSLPQTIEDRAWMKHIIHLGGGANSAEQQTIKRNLEGMAEIAETNAFAAETFGFYKQSTSPVQVSVSEEIFNTINNGVSIVTFFGHSGANTFDFNIDNPQNYFNSPRFPMMFSLGCYFGNIHTAFQGVSERFTLAEDQAMIGVGASSNLGFISELNPFMRQYYELMGAQYYGRSIGDIQKATVEELQFTSSSYTRVTLLEQFSLHADPALRLNPHPGPDYLVDASSVQFNPSLITTQLDSFELNFDIVNIGSFQEDSMTVLIEQEYPDNTRNTIAELRLLARGASTNISAVVPGLDEKAVGINKFYVTVDVLDEIQEMPQIQAESNNRLVNNIGGLGVELFVSDNSLSILYPSDFSIVNDADLSFYASTTNALAESQQYLLEIDTTAMFNSPTLIRANTTSEGGIIKWSPENHGLNMADGEVYYWRVTQDSISPQLGYTWQTSSFTFLPDGGEGWSQRDFWQLTGNNLDFLQYDTSSRKLDFVDDFQYFRMKNNAYRAEDPPRYINNQSSWSSPFRFTIPAGIQVIVRDQAKLKYIVNPPSGLYSSQNGGRRLVAFPYETNTLENRNLLLDFLENDTIKNGDYVLLYTVMNSPDADFNPENWAADSTQNNGLNIFNYLENQGASRIRELEGLGSVPYVLLYRKGQGVIREEIGTDSLSVLIVEQSIPGKWFEGSMRSQTIGPAKSWNRIELDINEEILEDTSSVNVYGINVNGGMELLRDSIGSTTSLTDIDASAYPYLQLEFNARDKFSHTSAELNQWTVFFEGYSDLAVDPGNYFVKADTTQRGAEWQIATAVSNIGTQNYDSVEVSIQIKDADNSISEFIEKLRPLGPFETDTVLLSYIPESGGDHQIQMEVNPDRNPLEQVYINNFLITDFFALQDEYNPIIDVTIDGTYIQTGDIINPSPLIRISLKDENEYLDLKDETNFDLKIIYPDQTERDLSRFNYSVESSTDGTNELIILLEPEFELDGEYQLTVNGRDESGNKSGVFDYKLAFQVITAKSISKVINYPNPFSSSTRFMYTLTGSEIPQKYRLQVFTISGRVVAEFDETDLGTMRIGTNFFDLNWDGKDQYGDKLANGTYLYRFVTELESGEELLDFETSIDKFYKNSFGKLTIIR